LVNEEAGVREAISGDVRLDICVHSPATGHAVTLHKAEEEALTVKFSCSGRAVGRARSNVQRGNHVLKFVNDIPAS
jgi:hypothetical protein